MQQPGAHTSSNPDPYSDGAFMEWVGKLLGKFSVTSPVDVLISNEMLGTVNNFAARVYTVQEGIPFEISDEKSPMYCAALWNLVRPLTYHLNSQ